MERQEWVWCGGPREGAGKEGMVSFSCQISLGDKALLQTLSTTQSGEDSRAQMFPVTRGQGWAKGRNRG